MVMESRKRRIAASVMYGLFYLIGCPLSSYLFRMWLGRGEYFWVEALCAGLFFGSTMGLVHYFVLAPLEKERREWKERERKEREGEAD
jgi:predicted membrane protein